MRSWGTCINREDRKERGEGRVAWGVGRLEGTSACLEILNVQEREAHRSRSKSRSNTNNPGFRDSFAN